MKLYFKNVNNKKRFIKDCIDDKDVYTSIKNFCDERNYEIPYYRGWEENGVQILDVGSHSEFFELEN